jgi:hypothetical protein
MIFLLIAITQLLNTTSIKEVVEEFHELKMKDAEVIFIQKYENSSIPSILAYVVAVEMKQIEYVFNPATKFKIYIKNKNYLNDLIEENPEDVHLRYIRLLLQEETPSFLGYNKFIEEDKLFLRKKRSFGDDNDYLYSYILKNTSL